MKKISLLIFFILLLSFNQNQCSQDQKTNSPSANFLSSYDLRYLLLSTLGLSMGGLGLWIIKQSVDRILADKIPCDDTVPLRDRILTLGSESLATLIGLICAFSGGLLIITDNYKINSAFNT